MNWMDFICGVFAGIALTAVVIIVGCCIWAGIEGIVARIKRLEDAGRDEGERHGQG